jgi:SMC interacting uncharacterized protein involved in chromosome segregation
MMNTSEIFKDAKKMQQPKRVKTAREVITERMEREIAIDEQVEKVLKFLEKYEGKKFTKRLIEPIMEASGNDHIYTLPGKYSIDWFKLQSHDYFTSDCEKGFSLTLGRGDKSPIISMEYIREENAYYCSGIKENIKEAKEKLNSNYPEQVDEQAANLRKIRKDFEQLTDEIRCCYALRELAKDYPPMVKV